MGKILNSSKTKVTLLIITFIAFVCSLPFGMALSLISGIGLACVVSWIWTDLGKPYCVDKDGTKWHEL